MSAEPLDLEPIRERQRSASWKAADQNACVDDGIVLLAECDRLAAALADAQRDLAAEREKVRQANLTIRRLDNAYAALVSAVEADQ